MKRLMAFSALFVALLFSAAFFGQNPREDGDKKPPPRFEDFPVTEVWKGPPAPVKIQSKEERLFRTNLRDSIKKTPNFAGHYSLVFWGCGTSCLSGAIVDQQTGNVFQPPLSTNGDGGDHWGISGYFVFDKPPVLFQSDSRLVIIRSEINKGKNGWIPDVYYFVWENEKFRLTLHTIAGHAVDANP
jgi:hypothetical protein